MLQPKRVKYRKAHRGHRRGTAHAGTTVIFGEFGLQAQESAWITSRQIEA
ncbi:MAG: ribosomal protein L16, partial [Dehalococcoidia bacterium]